MKEDARSKGEYIKDLLERDKPAQVIRGERWAMCPKCRHRMRLIERGFLRRHPANFCEACGQRLSFSELFEKMRGEGFFLY